jgi:hypothetical protein
MKPAAVLVEIQIAISRLIQAGLSVEQNWPVLRRLSGSNQEIAIEGAPALSVSMKDVPYRSIYTQLRGARAFHVQMIDGTLVQMLYRFAGDTLVGHRLATFPSPDLEPYDSDPDVYDNDDVYGDITAKNIVHVPLRFDYDSESHKDVDHPKSHLTIGQYENCRIPVNSPVPPGRFLRFLLRNFYFTAFHVHGLRSVGGTATFAETITAREQAISHLVC